LKTPSIKKFISSAALLLSAGSALAASGPNIIYILADDLGYGDLSCYGQKKFETPNIDRLASEGMKFTQHYSGSSVCAPSRCALMTGLHTGHAQVRGNREIRPEGQEPMRSGTVTIPNLLKQAGYTCGMFGKWGLGAPGSASDPTVFFDEFYGYNCQRQSHSFYPDHLWHNNEKVELDGKTYSHDLIMDAAIDFIRVNQGGPFFCYLAVTIPHAAMQAPKALHDKYRKLYPQFEDQVGKYGGAEVQNPVAAFPAMVEHLDKGVGEILDLLKELGIDNNTVVMFTSDNGPHQECGHDPEFWDSNGPLRGIKRDLYEGGIRAPFLARWPENIKLGTVSNHPSAFWDMLPTFCEMAGIDAPKSTDGISILPALLGQEQEQHDYLYWEFYEQGGRQAIRKGDWKAIRLNVGKNPDGPLELYDLGKDVGETVDVSGKHPEVVKELEALMKRAHVESEDYRFGGKQKKEQRKGSDANAGETGVLPIANQPIELSCKVIPNEQSSDGVLVAQGGITDGYSIYVKNGLLQFTVTRNGEKTSISSKDTVPEEPYAVKASLAKGGEMVLWLNSEPIASGNAGGLISRTPGEPFAVAEDRVTAAGNYNPPFAFKGRVADAKLNGKLVNDSAVKSKDQ
jgi:arylsulfatase A